MDKKDEIVDPTSEVTDLTSDQIERVKAFMEKGTPGIASIDDSKMWRMMELYLSGKSYNNISRTMGIEKDIVLYLSHKMNWTNRKREFLIEMSNNIQERLLETRLVSQNFLIDLTSYWHKKLGSRIQKYSITGDEKDSEGVSKQDIAMYLKTLEMLGKAIGPNKDSDDKPSPVSLNPGENGITLKKTGNGQIEVTPKAKTIGTVLKDFANLRREEDKKKSEKKTNNE